MSKFLLCFFWILAGCCWPFDGLARSADEYVAHQIAQSSVVIEVNFFGWSPIGSGTLVRDEDLGLIIVTAEHVATALPFQYRACSVLDEGECVELDNFILDSDQDLPGDWAIYQVDSKPRGMRAARVSHEELRVGQDLWQAGCPDGRVAYINRATLAWAYKQDGVGIYLLNGFARPGSSGGGLFNRWGQLVGITVAIPVVSDDGKTRQLMENQVLVVPITNIPLL